MKETRFIDTSILLEILEVPNKCQDPKKYQKEFKEFIQQPHVSLVMPISVLIETGNHLNHIKGNQVAKEKSINKFIDILKLFIHSTSPWYFYGYNFTADDIGSVIEKYQEFKYSGTGIGDVFILDSYDKFVADLRGSVQNHRIVIWTLDKHLTGYCTEL